MRGFIVAAVLTLGLLGPTAASALSFRSAPSGYAISFTSSQFRSYEQSGVNLGSGHLASFFDRLQEREHNFGDLFKKIIGSIAHVHSAYCGHNPPPGPAVPEPAAALVFASALLLIARRRV